MKNSIGYQLFTRGFIIVLFILLLAVAGQICISLLNRTSNKVFTEYLEMDALQEYRTKLNRVIIHFDNFVLNDNSNTRKEFENSIADCSTEFEKCEEVITHRHDRSLLLFFEKGLVQLDSLKNESFTLNPTPEKLNEIHEQIIKIVSEGNAASEVLLQETKIEIDEYVEINNTAVRHSTITIVSLGVILLVIVTVGGFLFIKKLTGPISILLASTKKVGEGEFGTIAKVDSNNEINELAESFNSMVKTLKKTTISRNYYDNILENMIELLIVIDSTGRIETINQKAINLLGYKNKELRNSKIEKLFMAPSQTDNPDSESKELELEAISNQEMTLLSKKGEQIPVLVSTSILNNNKGEIAQYILVARDLTERKAMYQKLEKERKEKQIAINDAHEEEKFRIAIDLHDGLGQILTATSYSFQNYFGERSDGDPEYQKSVENVQSMLDTAIIESKNIAHNLIPIALKDFGLVVAINNLLEQANQKSEIKFSFDTFNYTTRINQKLEKAIFRIFQEAMNNIIKHSKAKNASFQINKYDDTLVIVIEDDGIGFDFNKKNTSNKLNGIGLIGMQERIMAFNGDFTINTKPNAGTEILIELPCFN